MALYQRFLRKPEFGSYEDFLHNFRINVPENFNFAYDVLDVIAQEEPDKRALRWVHMDGRERAFTLRKCPSFPQGRQSVRPAGHSQRAIR